jgi:hypothetical protein
MKGNNVIELNAATVIEAVQEYLDKRTVGGRADKVEAVSFTSGWFRFTTCERKPGEK